MAWYTCAGPVLYLWYYWSLFIHILTCNISGKSRQVPIPTFCLQQILNGISQKYQAAGQELVQNILLRFCTTRPGVGTSDLHPEAGQWGPELSKIKSSCLAHLWMSIEINLGSSDWLILLVTVPQSVTVGTTHCLAVLALILASSTCLKEFKLNTVYSGTLQHRKNLQLDREQPELAGPAAEFKTTSLSPSSSSSPCRSSGNQTKRLFEKTIKGSHFKIK